MRTFINPSLVKIDISMCLCDFENKAKVTKIY